MLPLEKHAIKMSRDWKSKETLESSNLKFDFFCNLNKEKVILWRIFLVRSSNQSVNADFLIISRLHASSAVWKKKGKKEELVESWQFTESRKEKITVKMVAWFWSVLQQKRHKNPRQEKSLKKKIKLNNFCSIHENCLPPLQIADAV